MRRAARSNSLFVVQFKQCPRSNLRFHLRELRKVIVDLNFLQSSSVCREALVEGNGVTFRVLREKETNWNASKVFVLQPKEKNTKEFSNNNEPSSWKWKEGFSNQLVPSRLWIEVDCA